MPFNAGKAGHQLPWRKKVCRSEAKYKQRERQQQAKAIEANRAWQHRACITSCVLRVTCTLHARHINVKRKQNVRNKIK